MAMRQNTKTLTIKTVAASVVGLGLSASAAFAGGFEVREQSTFFQGMSFAGAAASGDSISSMFWNPATASIAGPGLTTESNYALIIPRADLTINNFNGTVPCNSPAVAFAFGSNDCSEDIGRLAVVPASYLAWRYNAQTVFALSMNSQYGLGTKPDNPMWAGNAHAQTSKLFSLNIAPTVSYEIMPGISLGAGVQFQYLDLKRLRGGTPGFPAVTNTLEGDDLGVGFTLGVNFKPTSTTSIGIGYRSKIEHKLSGSLALSGPTPPLPPGGLAFPITATLDTPEKVTASFRQELSSNMRLLGTVEWVNWSRLGVVPIQGTGGALTFNWDDGWFFSLGAEYDVNDKLTVRAGGAYEISPIQSAESRLMQVPDADRIWASIGATYKWSEAMSLDFAYSHVFVEDASFSRDVIGQPPGANFIVANGTADSAVDIISVGLKMKLPPFE
jgi:long-chain fatty acid transport protein